MPGLTAVDLSSSSNNGKKDDFKMTPEEAKRLEEKMKDPEFMKLWVEYAQSLADPKVRAEEEEYLRQVEEEAKNTGDDSFDFIFPKPAYCIELLNCPDKKKGCSRVGVNICTSDKIERFTEQATGRNRMGHWYVPVSLSLAREEKKALENSDWEVFDAVFHPDTVKLANQSDQFTTFLTQIIVENINEGYKRRFEFEYKRFPSSVTQIGTDPKNQTVRRDSAKASKSSSSASSSSKDAGTSREVTLGPIKASFNEDEIAKKTQQQKIVVESAQSSKASSPTSAHHSPSAKQSAQQQQQLSKNTGNIKMTVAHRGEIDLTDAWNWAKLDKRIGIPKELVLRAQLPTVDRASELDVDIVKGVSVEIACPAKKLQGAMMLDFTVEETPVSAKFERTKKELTLVLKVVPPPAPPSAVAPAEEAQEQHQNKNNDDDDDDDEQQQQTNKKQQEQADAAEEKRQQEEKERVERLKRAQELLEEKKRREEKQEQEEKDKAAEKAKKEAEAQEAEKKRAKEQQEEMMRKRQEAWLKEEEERKQQQQKKKAEEEEAELKRKKAVEEEQERKAKEAAAAAKIINNNNDDDANNNNNQQHHEEQDSSSLLLIDDDDEDFMPKKSDTENKKDEMLLREAAKKSADAQKQEETMQAELDKKMKQLPLTNAFIFSID